MGRSKTGGAFGFIRGRVGAVSYNIISAKRSSTGKKMQGMRAIPEEVANPQTVSQCLQRMKLSPAQKFYAAFVELLSNAFQSVEYGQKSRNYFLSKAMKTDGPYVPKGVDRFIPGQYLFSEGSIKSVGINPFSGGATVITLDVKTAENEVTPAILAAALGVTIEYQITVAVVNNKEGIFVPSYIGYDQRLMISDIPAAALSRNGDGYITIDIAAMGLDASAVVAMCVVLSYQDISGKWLRSTQTMVVSNELIAQLYSSDAMEEAILSYQTEGSKAANAINSEWYYNLGMNQQFAGKLTTGYINIKTAVVPAGMDANAVIGLKQSNGIITKTLFFTSLDENGVLVVYEDGYIRPARPTDNFEMPIITYTDYQNDNRVNSAYQAEIWKNVYAQQIGIQTTGLGDVTGVSLYLANGDVIQGVSIEQSTLRGEPIMVVRTADNSGYYIKSDNDNSRFYSLNLVANERLTGNAQWQEFDPTTGDNVTILVDDSNGASQDPHAVDNFNNLINLGLNIIVFVNEA